MLFYGIPSVLVILVLVIVFWYKRRRKEERCDFSKDVNEIALLKVNEDEEKVNEDEEIEIKTKEDSPTFPTKPEEEESYFYVKKSDGTGKIHTISAPELNDPNIKTLCGIRTGERYQYILFTLDNDICKVCERIYKKRKEERINTLNRLSKKEDNFE
jgi:hypothetical protein